MTTSQTPFLSEPSGEDQIPATDLAYIKARGRQQGFNIIHAEMKRRKVSQATICRRLNTTADVVSRLLRRPGNWEQDTFSALLFAVTGASFSYRLEYPQKPAKVPHFGEIDDAPRNRRNETTHTTNSAELVL